MNPTAFAGIVLGKARRDRDLGWSVVIGRGVRYGWELATARFYLRHVDVVGSHARTLCRPRIQNLGRIEIGSHVLLTSINVPVELGTGPHGTLRLGNGIRLNYGTSIYAESAVTIGNRALIGPYVMIADTDFHDVHDRARRLPGRPVVIEDDVWIGAKASVLKGVRIGRGAVVGVGAVVTRDVQPFSIVAGVPARVVGVVDPARFRVENVA